MKIEIIECSCEQFGEQEKCNGETCFDAPASLHNSIANCNSIYGIVIFDNIAVKFYYSPLANDGDIFTIDDGYRTIIKTLIPVYVHNKQFSAQFRK